MNPFDMEKFWDNVPRRRQEACSVQDATPGKERWEFTPEGRCGVVLNADGTARSSGTRSIAAASPSCGTLRFKERAKRLAGKPGQRRDYQGTGSMPNFSPSFGRSSCPARRVPGFFIPRPNKHTPSVLLAHSECVCSV